jgi:hypothetical protein
MVDDRRVLEGVTRLVVDGTNVLFALRRSPAPLPAAALIGRLRSVVPPTVAITVVLDGRSTDSSLAMSLPGLRFGIPDGLPPTS